MTGFQPRQPQGVPTGGQFTTTARAETGVTLDSPAQAAGDPTPRLLDLMDAYVGGTPFVENIDAALSEVVPDVPGRIADALWHQAVVDHLHGDLDARDAALARIVTWQEREARWAKDSTFTSPTAEVTEEGTNGPVTYTTAVGGKYTGFRDVADVAKDVRQDLKAARDAGYLPEDVTFAVTTSKFSGGQAMDITVRGLTDDLIYEDDPASWHSGRRYSAEAIEIRDRIEAIGKAYDRSTTDMQTDYFNVTYFCNAQLEDEQSARWREHEAARRKAAKAR